MKALLITLGIALCFAVAPLRADLLLQPHDTLAICGDSITQQKLYSVFMEDYLLMCGPVDGLRVAQFGWSGEVAAGFGARIDSDVAPFKPTAATTCYGMNDGGYSAMSDGTAFGDRHAMTAAVEKLKTIGVKTIVVGSPGCVDGAVFSNPRTTADVYNQTLDSLRGIAQDVAQKEGVGFADIHTPMMDVMAKAKAAYGNSYAFVAGGGVHPNNNGQLVMAYAFLKALGCDGAIGTLTVDLGSNQATCTPGQKILSCEDGSVEVESSRYPFCFQGDPDKPDQNTACILKFFPFNDDLNRYMVVVKGLKGSKAKVTWGTTTKEFAAADLNKGINLASEFLDNPFCDQFNKVNAAVLAQQAHETDLVKQYMHLMPALKVMVPTEVDSIDKIASGGLQHDKDLFGAAVALVTPIHHTIKVESEP
jgi:lysophospholipase L1-like esterase